MSTRQKAEVGFNFTKAALEALPSPESGRAYYRDTHDPRLHLGVAVTPAGAKSFFVQRRVNGRPVRMMLGRFPEVAIAEARRKAAKLNLEIAADMDPYERTRPARTGATLRKFFEDEYLTRHAKPFKRSWRQDVAMFEAYLGPIAGRPLGAITRRDVQRLHVAIAERVAADTRQRAQLRIERAHARDAQPKKPTGPKRLPSMVRPMAERPGHETANKVVNLVRSIFGKAAEWGFYGGANPGEGVRKFQTRARERYLRPEEVPPFFEALYRDAEVQGTTLWRDFFLTCLYTGARRSNVQAMRWADVDLVRGVWTIQAATTKTGRTYTLALPRVAIELLDARLPLSPKGCPWVFPAPSSKADQTTPWTHMTEPKAAWARIRYLSGLADLRIHDLRRTLGSWQAAAGASLPIIGRSLGHVNPGSTAIYARLSLDPVRESVERATAAIRDAGTTKPKTKHRSKGRP